MFLKEQAVKTEIRLVYGARTVAVDECVCSCFFRELIKTNALSELSDQLLRASLPGMCRAGRPGFESRSYLNFLSVILTSYTSRPLLIS